MNHPSPHIIPQVRLVERSAQKPRWLKMRLSFDRWQWLMVVLALAVALPLGVLFLYLLDPQWEIWQHLAQTVLPDLLKNTAILSIGVLSGTFALGVGLAWLTGVCEFPGRRFFSWALLLPMAMPAYVLAFVFLGLLDFSGPLQTLLRELYAVWWPGRIVRFPNVRSAGGVILVMTLALYPYVYLLARNAFKTQGRRALEAARGMGYSRTAAFFKVALPMARPWIAGGLMLVLMETLADFGAVSIFNFDTFTTAIYKTWFGFFSLAGAAQLSTILVVIVLLVLVAEQRLRAKRRYTQAGRMSVEDERICLKGWHRTAATGVAAAVVAVAFVLPFVQLLLWVADIWAEEFSPRYLAYLRHSLALAGTATMTILASAIALAYAQRQHDDPLARWLVRVATLGYALPGTVLSVGIFIVFSHFDRALLAMLQPLIGEDFGPILQGSVVVVMAAYLIRFMAAGFNGVAAAMQRITPSIDEASISLGVTGIRMLKRVHLPILKNGLLTAAVMVFVDVMKEMPITLMTRPFGWDTLAVKIFELTSEGEWERAALPAVVLVLCGMVPVVLLMRRADAA